MGNIAQRDFSRSWPVGLHAAASGSAGRLDWGAASDAGRSRTHNEDCWKEQAELGVFVLADGMGGYNAGEVASSIAVDAVVDFLAAASQQARLRDPSAGLIQAILRANEAILAAAARRPECLGMGTTVAAVAFVRDSAWFAHVGDSRVYLQRAGALVRLTRDHSVGQAMADAGLAGDAAKTMAMGGVLTRALGVGVSVDPDVGHVGVADGDRLLLCSDGLTDLVAEESIRGLLGRREPADLVARLLIEAALDAGGLDNVTALVIDIGDTVPGR